MKTPSKVLFLILSLSLAACGKDNPTSDTDPTAALPPVGVPNEAGAVVHGRAITTVTQDQPSEVAKLLNFLMAPAYASTGSTTVTYTNAGSTHFTINVAALVPGAMTGNTLSLGTVSIASLSDNNLNVCGTGGTTKCTQAVIRVYTLGTIAGFVNTADGYGVPVYTGTLNPTVALGLNSAGSVPVQKLTLAATKHTTAIADFPSPNYGVKADFSNGGAGAYSMTYVVEYVLLP